MNQRRGVFISFEGIEGTGKTTQAGLLKEFLERKGYTVTLTKEPGGTVISDRIREILLSAEYKEMDPITELLLYFASRRQHIKELIQPALDKGRIVITDRFADSTVAYQGYARGIDLNLINYLSRSVAGGLMPDLTILLDMDVEAGLRRNKGKKFDRLELEAVEFHKRVREGYRILAGEEPERIRLIDSSKGISAVHAEAAEIAAGFLDARFQAG
ncbi:MAG: dTMP kinase [Thermodesulfovibrionales bacterium]|nr:dTMP kinase [Thermodesulfovibrionales bacterium]